MLAKIENFFEKYPEEKVIKWFKDVCKYEALSWLLLISAMIWKRYDTEGTASLVYIIVMGNIHGLFFTLYLLLTIPARKIFDWDDEDSVFALLSAFFPFATIWVDKSLAKKERE